MGDPGAALLGEPGPDRGGPSSAGATSEARRPADRPDGSIDGQLDRWFVPIGLVILLVAAALRLPELALNPFHHDEGVNGFFTTRLVRTNVYAYDPANYHGPSLYYFALASTILFGLTTEALRLVPVVAGLLTIAFILPFRRYLGPLATLTAAGLLAISPGAVYMSRYFIHEAPLVCFSLGLAVSAILYLDQRRPVFLLTGAAAAALLFATKETGIITVLVLLIAAFVADRYVAYRHPARRRRTRESGRPSGRDPGTSRPARSIWIDGVEYRPAQPEAAPARGSSLARGPTGRGGDGSRSEIRPTAPQLVGAATMFLVIYVMLFSSFFTNFPKGLVDSLASFAIWTQTGDATQVQPFYKYLEWMARADAPLLMLGAAGGVLVAARGTDRLSVFIGLWALGLTLAYSVIQYKTPWIVLNMLIPLALLAGLLVRELWTARVYRRAVPVLLVASTLLSGYQAIDLNFQHFDDETYPYVFVHTTRDGLALVEEIEQSAKRAGTARQTGVVLFTPDHWPLPWYLRNYPRAGYYGQVVPTQEAIVVANVNQEKDLTAEFTAAYARQREYTLRPGVKLVLYLRRATFGL